MSSHSPQGLSGMDPDTLKMLLQLAKLAASSDLVKGAYGQKATESQCLMKLLYGHDLGIPATAALTGIQIYDGQMEVGSRLLSGLVQRHPVYGYELKSCNDQGCTLTFLKNGLPDGDVTYGIDQAERAGLLGTDWYTKHPESMFFARAIALLVARKCPDVTHGIAVYAEGEIQAGMTDRAPRGNDDVTAPAGPADAIVTDDDVNQIKQAAQEAGVTDGQLYNVIGVVAGGRGGVDVEQAAQRLPQIWARMPQRFRTPVLAALASPELVAAAQTTASTSNGDPAIHSDAPQANGRGQEPLASEGDVRRIRTVAAEMNVNDAALANLIAEVIGGKTCDDDPERAKELLPATFAALPLRFVQPVLTRLRPPQTQPAEVAGEASVPEAAPASETITVDFSSMAPQTDEPGDDSDVDAQHQQAA